LYDGNIEEAARVFGYLASCNSFVSFLVSPLFGVLSDRYGRKPLFIVVFISCIIDIAAFSLTNTIWILFITRIIGGGGTGAFALTLAMIADITSPKDRAKNFGLIGLGIGGLITNSSDQF